MTGNLRRGRATIPFTVTIGKSAVRYEFPGTSEAITAPLENRATPIQWVRNGRAVPLANWREPIGGTDARYEDLLLPLRHENEGRVVGEDIISACRCWKLEISRESAGEADSVKVFLWVSKEDRALMKAEFDDGDGNWTRRLTVRSVAKYENRILPRQVRIESADARNAEPTYLEFDYVEERG